MMTERTMVPIRGYLLHLTHYSPGWYLRKRREKAIDLKLAFEIIDAIAEAGFNLLIIDCEDGLVYTSHPELRRRYSIPQSSLRRLLNYARNKYLEVVPKLNFSQSRYHRHSYWFRPYYALLDTDKYWKVAFDLMDELVEIFRPKRFFHIGMDEDDTRSHAQYIKAILTLRGWLKKRGLRTIIWNDSTLGRFRPWHTRKSRAAEKAIPKDIVQIIWDYKHVKPGVLRRILNEGFEAWVAPGQTTLQVLRWEKFVLKYGAKGLLMTTWMPCRPRNRSRMLNLIRTVGPVYSSTLVR